MVKDILFEVTTNSLPLRKGTFVDVVDADLGSSKLLIVDCFNEKCWASFHEIEPVIEWYT